MKVSSRMVTCMEGIRPWVQFLSVIGFLIALSMLAAAALTVMSGIKALEADGKAASGMFVIGGVLVLNGMLAAYPASRLWAFGGACHQFAESRSWDVLETGLKHHRQFWQFWGVLTIVTFILNASATGLIFLISGLGRVTGGG